MPRAPAGRSSGDSGPKVASQALRRRGRRTAAACRVARKRSPYKRSHAAPPCPPPCSDDQLPAPPSARCAQDCWRRTDTEPCTAGCASTPAAAQLLAQGRTLHRPHTAGPGTVAAARRKQACRAAGLSCKSVAMQLLTRSMLCCGQCGPALQRGQNGTQCVGRCQTPQSKPWGCKRWRGDGVRYAHSCIVAWVAHTGRLFMTCR